MPVSSYSPLTSLLTLSAATASRPLTRLADLLLPRITWGRPCLSPLQRLSNRLGKVSLLVFPVSGRTGKQRSPVNAKADASLPGFYIHSPEPSETLSRTIPLVSEGLEGFLQEGESCGRETASKEARALLHWATTGWDVVKYSQACTTRFTHQAPSNE